MNRPMTYVEISELDEKLCEHCRCTDYGFDMKAPNAIMGVTFGCESGWCDEAYQNYLKEFEEE